MGIETRGNDNVLVVSGSAVLVDDIGDAVLDRKNLDWLCKRFPITVDEVFQCIETLAEMSTGYKDGITLINRGNEKDILLETISVNETLFFGLIDYGHSIKPDALDFDIIYNTGLVKVIEDIYFDLRDGEHHFEVSELHDSVYQSIRQEIGDIEPDLILSSIQKGDIT
jgi:hypothetical protein